MENGGKKQNNLLIAQNGGMLYSLMVVCVFFTSVIYSAVCALTGSSNVLVSYLLGPVSILVAVILLGLKVKNNPISPLLPLKLKLYPTLGTLLVFIGLTFGLSGLNEYFALWLKSLGVTVSPPSIPELSPLNLALTIIFVCLLPAFFEELAFRGIMQNYLKQSGTWFSILISGLLFSLFHMSPTQTLYQFACGVVYALIIVCGGNFLNTFIIHFLNNLFVILNYYYFGLETTLVSTVIGLAFLVAGIILLIKTRQKTEIDTRLIKYERTGFILNALVGVGVALTFWLQGLFL
ncbi:MAG: CPBP family intramembrane metalloprotease [Clostridia bacterium]|nr:CPBP family intramembrane metalloprotease [Clostridia bacterium]